MMKDCTCPECECTRIRAELEAVKKERDELGLKLMTADYALKDTQDQLATVTRERDHHIERSNILTEGMERLAEVVDACQKECSSLRSDAERWKAVRLMRPSQQLYDVFNPCPRTVEDENWREMSDEEYATHRDAAIDAAMQKKKS